MALRACWELNLKFYLKFSHENAKIHKTSPQNKFFVITFKQDLARISCRFYAVKVRSSFLTLVKILRL